jgi:hypothetical protein
VTVEAFPKDDFGSLASPVVDVQADANDVGQ